MCGLRNLIKYLGQNSDSETNNLEIMSAVSD